MNLDFRCTGCEIDGGTKGLIEDRIQRLGKYVGEIDMAEVHIERSPNPANENRVTAEITLRLSKTVARAKAVGAEEIAAFDKAEQKIKHQLEKLKGKLVARSHPHHRQGKTADLAGLSENPSIAKRKVFELETLDPEAAALRMELLSHSFFLFVNALTNRSAVVYLRGDGSVGLIDQVSDADQ